MTEQMKGIDYRCEKNCRYYLFGPNAETWEREGGSEKANRPPTPEELTKCQTKADIVKGYDILDLVQMVSEGYENLIHNFFKEENTAHEIYLVGSRAKSETPIRPCADYDFSVVPLDKKISKQVEYLLWEMRRIRHEYFDLPPHVEVYIGGLNGDSPAELIFSTKQKIE